MIKYMIMVLLLLVPSTYEAYALVTMMINLEDEDEGENSLSSIEIEESKNPNDLNTLCNYVSGCTYEFAAILDISSVSTNEDGSTQEHYFGDIQFQPSCFCYRSGSLIMEVYLFLRNCSSVSHSNYMIY